jgi:3-deoxy-manno-octulosonate cytidylyltransferase (CMP-KDO synthetase)
MIHDKTMIEHVISNCRQSGFDYCVVTDDERIESSILSLGENVVRVDDDVSTGSERIALAYNRHFSEKGYDFIVNVQGDEPLPLGDIIQKIGKSHEKSNFDIYTAVKKRSWNNNEKENPNVVKCILSPKHNQCLYFSRAAIPFVNDNAHIDWFQHVGVYSYRVSALMKFVQFPESYLEKAEKLEQLRALENGLTIGAEEISIELLGVDTPEDIGKVEGALSE